MLIDNNFEKETLLKFLQHELLMVFIIAEKKNPDSKYKNFLDTLPLTYDSFPEMFSDEELEWIKGSPLFEEAMTRKKYAATSY
jgi:hypothetical protein